VSRPRRTQRKVEHSSLCYHLLKKDGKWMVYDVAIEGGRLVSNYRGQFNRIINSQGCSKLDKKLRAKSEEIKAPQAL
jgi:phospholipid transport system substrate-binding protein